MPFAAFPTFLQWEAASVSKMEKLSGKVLNVHAYKPKVARINELVARYAKVLDMARLNVLMELREAILDWASDSSECASNPERLAATQALLDVTLRTIAELDSWGKHRYVKAVCIGYQVETGWYNPGLKPADDKQRAAHDEEDVAKTCADLINAISTAQKSYQSYVNTNGVPADEDRKTLKIFMAPEFLFRGRYGAYGDIGLCAKILAKMREEIKELKYEDWLFVHGTAIFATERDAKLGGGMLLENYALVQKGGLPGKTSDHVVAKEFPSHVDFTHPFGKKVAPWYDPNQSKAAVTGEWVKHVGPVGGRQDPIYEPLTKTPAPALSELTGGVIFTMDNITFGLEVCRDHCMARLAHSKESGKALIQLIPSAGMGIEKDGLGCAMDGIVFNVDGVDPHIEIQVRSPLAAKQPKKVKTEPYGAGEIQIFSAAKIPWPAQVRLDVAQRLDITQGAASGVAPLRKVA